MSISAAASEPHGAAAVSDPKGAAAARKIIAAATTSTLVGHGSNSKTAAQSPWSQQRKYDLRAHLREFSIARPATAVEFATFTEALRLHGYIGDAEVYYLNPAPWSKPSTGLVKIVGAEEVNQMVHAHAQEGTKICHLYLVSRYEDQAPDEERAMESSLSWESDEEAEEGETSHGMIE